MTSVVLWPALPVPPGGNPDPPPGAGIPAVPATSVAPVADPVGGATAPATTPVLLVVAGTEPRNLVAGLLDDALLDDALLDGALPDQPGGAHLVLRAGPAGGRAYIPGHRAPRELTADWVTAGPPTRPPRRVEVTLPVALLEHVHLVVTPTRPPSPAGTEILTDAVRQTGGLVYVLDATVPLAPEHRDELAAASRAATCTLLVDTRDATEAERATIVRQVPALQNAVWCRAADLAGIVELISDWPRPAAAPVPAQRTTSAAPRVTDNDRRWRAALDCELHTQAELARQQLAGDLVALQTRCAVEPAALPAALDVDLHALSLRTTASLDRSARAVIRAVFAEVVPGGMSDSVLASVTAAVARDLEPDERTLLVTATAEVASVVGTAGLSATGSAVPAVPSPICVAVSGNCHLTWRYRGVPDKTEGRRWLHQAVQAADRELTRVLAERFVALGEAVEALAADAVDHGVLLV